MDIQEPEFTSEQVRSVLFTQDAANQCRDDKNINEDHKLFSFSSHIIADSPIDMHHGHCGRNFRL